jgi:hypothetical protein
MGGHEKARQLVELAKQLPDDEADALLEELRARLRLLEENQQGAGKSFRTIKSG